jgi:hypothetical protein
MAPQSTPQKQTANWCSRSSLTFAEFARELIVERTNALALRQ